MTFAIQHTYVCIHMYMYIRACWNASGARKEALALFSEPRKIKTQLQEFFVVVSLMRPFHAPPCRIALYVLEEPMCDYQTCRPKPFHVFSCKHLPTFHRTSS